jgi:hypothetical protein
VPLQQPPARRHELLGEGRPPNLARAHRERFSFDPRRRLFVEALAAGDADAQRLIS